MPRRVFGADPAIAARRRHAFARGLRAVAPATVATGTWGLVTGVAMVKVGLTTAQALGMTLLVYAGSAQLAALPLIAAAAPIWVVLLTATVVNLRFVIFSAGLRPFFRRFSLGRRLFLGYVTTDIGFALFLSRFANAPDEERGSLGAGVVLPRHGGRQLDGVADDVRARHLPRRPRSRGRGDSSSHRSSRSSR